MQRGSHDLFVPHATRSGTTIRGSPLWPFNTAAQSSHATSGIFEGCRGCLCEPTDLEPRFSLTAVERILAAQAQPKSVLDSLEAETRPHLATLVGEEPVPPRTTAEYRHLLEPSDPEHEPEDEDPT